MTSVAPWRVAFALSGVAMILGGPRHPSPHPDLPFLESTALMLAHPSWVPAHLFMLASYVLLLAGLVLWRRWAELPPRAAAWVRFTLVVLVLAVVEMAFHTASVLDLARLKAGRATPVLTTHLWLALVINPLLTIGLAGVALQAGRLGLLGSKWIVWLPIGGNVYGAASVYVILTQDQRASPLFAIGASLLAIWFLLVAAWPVHRAAPVAGPEAYAGAQHA